jgi:hypothetical protein
LFSDVSQLLRNGKSRNIGFLLEAGGFLLLGFKVYA